jgi:hypothetical protein
MMIIGTGIDALARIILVAFLATGLTACGGGSGAPAEPAPATEPPPPEPEPGPGQEPGPAPEPGPDGCTDSFDTTFEAIQTVVFERRGCTNDLCHGSAASGGLDLRADVAWQNLFDVPSTGSPYRRVVPGLANFSYLYLKLLAATQDTLPGGVTISGSPMPSGLPPLGANELEAIRKWIEVGASRDGVVGDNVDGSSSTIGDLLGACLPDATPISVEPLPPPAPDVGVQFEMPPYRLAAASEVEVCFASYYDYSAIVPEEFKTPDGESFYVNESVTRGDPHSHHFVITHSGLDSSYLNHPSFGAWACRNGPRRGEPCEPLDAGSCGGGLCASEVTDSVACIGYGPPEAAIDVAVGSLQGPSRAGYYAVRPLRGILYWNSHAFNLTTADHELRTRVNLYYATDRRLRGELGTDSSNIYIQAGQPPFTEQTYCATHVVPRGVELFRLVSHTHKRGGRFWVTDPGGVQIYESFVYSDPVVQEYDPPIVYDSPAAADRTLTYCAVYNNGLNPDGSPNPRTVTKLSSMPARTSCRPVACTAGQIGAPCNGAEDDASCDSTPGAGDGACDACPITAGVTTENEMFIIIPFYGVPED